MSSRHGHRLRAQRLRVAVTASIVIAVVAALVGGCGRSPGPGPGGLKPGDPLPGFDLPLLAGGRSNDGDLEGGEPVVLNFWATWCRPCVKEIPTLNELAKAEGVKVVSVALDVEGAEIVAPFVEAHGISYPVMLGDLELFQRFGGYAIPYTVVTDGGLTVRSVHRGLVSLPTLERDLAAARADAIPSGNPDT
ncbi:MAG: TlpA family protein disulfide reductase [Holophagales bacterium]|nr:TlpA family protein disulfide reductase [Holophagales bacterium]